MGTLSQKASSTRAEDANARRSQVWRTARRFLLSRHFALLWSGQTISVFGSYITGMGLPMIAAVLLHATPVQMGLLVALGALPGLLLGLFIGVLVDRLPRRPLLILADLGRALLLTLIPLLAVLGLLQLAWLYVLTVLLGLLTVGFDVASLAFLPTLLPAEKLAEGNSRLGTSSSLAEIAGPPMADTDWHVWNGDWDWVGLTPTLPLVMGHELGGTVVAVGNAVSRVREGDRVTAPFHESCGRCGYCLIGRSNLCDDMQFLGLTHDGGYAQYAAIRNADFNCVKLPDSIDSLSAAAIGCRYMTAFHAVTRQGKLAAGQWVAVHGAGGIGLSAVQIAAALGGRVIAVDLADSKLEKAVAEGALFGINGGTQDVAAEIKQITGGGADLAIGGIGVAALVESAVLSLRKGGRLVQVGLTSQAERGYVGIPLDHMIEAEIEIVGSVGNPHMDYPRLLGLVETGVLRPARIVGQRLPLEQASAVLDAMDSYETLGFSVITGF